jgi:hypothetical protein
LPRRRGSAPPLLDHLDSFSCLPVSMGATRVLDLACTRFRELILVYEKPRGSM